ncbi:RNA polymerase sigma factor [Leucobacter iarius]|uniref:RNA polymerase sigma factor n=1 Tax=Leucobacter iarius TaxID=333963 RepID=A0ABP4XV82_9MICO
MDAAPGEVGLSVDDRLRLLFACCDPTLSEEEQLALTLRLVCGLPVSEIADSLRVSETTMADRITRAAQRIAETGLPERDPDPTELQDRLEPVLAVVHLVFTSGRTAPLDAEQVRPELAERGIDLARMLVELLPGESEAVALLALLLLIDARRPARTDHEGLPVPLDAQDRRRWDRSRIAEGTRLLDRALSELGGGAPGRFALTAAIAAVHDDAETFADTDWAQIHGLYEVLAEARPSPTILLHRAIALGFLRGPAAGLTELDRLAGDPELAAAEGLAAARADLLVQLGRRDEARTAFEEALLLAEDAAERTRLEQRMRRLDAEPR